MERSISNHDSSDVNQALVEANRALRETNELLERIFQSTHLHIAYLDRDLNFIRVNANYAAHVGLTEDYLLGKNHFALFPHPENEAIFRQALKTGQPYSAVAKLFVFPDPPDQPAYWDWSLQPVREPDGHVSGLILSLIDVTEQHKAQMALAYQAFLLDHINDAIVAVDDKYFFTSWNRTAEEIYGWKREEALGKSVKELQNPEFLQNSIEDVWRILTEEGYYQGETLQTCKDGRLLVMETMVSVLRDETGRVYGYVAINRDISPRRQAEDAARQVIELMQVQAELAWMQSGANLDHRQMLEFLAIRVAELIGDACVITLLSEDRQALVPVAYYNTNAQAAALMRSLLANARIPIGSGISGQVALFSTMVMIPDLTLDEARVRVHPSLKAYVDQVGLYGVIIVPLKIRDRLVGTLGVTRDRPGKPYTSDDLAFLESLAGSVALWISNEELFDTVQKELAERRRVELELSEIQRRLLDGIEAERMDLARELHDGPVQELYGLAMQLRNLAAEFPAGSPPAEMAAGMQPTIQRIIDSLRATSMDLRPPALSRFGLEPVIASYCEQFEKMQPGLEITQELASSPDNPVSEDLRLALFRIFQVALTNILRHAQARRVVIRLQEGAETVLLEIQDDGVGFRVPERWVELARQGHLGLIGAVERVERFGGQMQVESQPGAGTTVRVILPRG